jgi:hypothetical protein
MDLLAEVGSIRHILIGRMRGRQARWHLEGGLFHSPLER